MKDKCWHTNRKDLLASIKDHWVIFDTSAINRLCDNDADDFWDELAKHAIEPCSIDPIILELLAHKDVGTRALRLEVINKLTPLSLQPKDWDTARKLQNELHAIASRDCSPSPTDLYIGAVAARFPYDKILIATENITDFPKPYFERVGYVLLEDKLRVKVVCLLRVSQETRRLVI